MIRGVYVSVFILDLLLVFGNRLFVTGNPAGLLGQYYEVPSSGSPPVILKKDPSGAPADPCLGARTGDGPRVLLLGDSYTEGSGRAHAPAVTPPKRRVRVPELVVGLLVTVLFALGAVLWHLNATSRVAALAVSSEVQRGEVIDSGDLRVVYIASDDSIARMPIRRCCATCRL